MKYIWVVPSKYKEVPKFEVVNHVRISKYKNIFAKGDIPGYSEQVLVIKMLKMLKHGLMLFSKLNSKELLERFPKQNCKKQNQKEPRTENLIKRKDDK